MKTSFISSLAMQNSMRTTILKAQTELVNLNTELTTGRHSDLGVTLAANTARSLDLHRDTGRIGSILALNAIATQRLESSQAALDSMAQAAQEIQQVLVSNSSSSEPTLTTVRTTISNALNNFTSFANTSVNGEFLFSGINTDVKPLDDFMADGSPLKAAYDLELNHFMSQLVPPVSTPNAMSTTQVSAFMDEMEAKFNGTSLTTSPPHAAADAGQDFWTAFGSSASDVNMSSRISQSEVVETSTNSNSNGMRYFVMTAVTSMTFLVDEVDVSTRELVAERSITNINHAIAGINQQQSKLGLSESRVSKANDALEAQKKIIENHLSDIEGIDTYEVKTRLDLLQQQIEIAYSLTTRLQQMSLVNYL